MVTMQYCKRHNSVSMQGRVSWRLSLVQRQHDMLIDPAWTLGSADLVWRNGTYYLHLTQSTDTPQVRETDSAIGVDLGIVNLATDSEGHTFTGTKVHEVRSRYHKRRQALQRVATRSAKRRLKTFSRRDKRVPYN